MTFAFPVLVALLGWRSVFSLWWLLVPASIFVWLARSHDRVLRAHDAAVRGVTFYERGLARLEDRWTGTGEAGDRFRDDRHVYANDLDLFGRGSLFELLSLARTRTGEETLAGWLMSPADASEILARQEALVELTASLDLREQVALAEAMSAPPCIPNRLLVWAESPIYRDIVGSAFVPGFSPQALSWPLPTSRSLLRGGRWALLLSRKV